MIDVKKKCRYPACVRIVRARGLCRSCHAQADRLVRQGKTTWEKLEGSRKVSRLSKRTRGFAEWLLA